MVLSAPSNISITLLHHDGDKVLDEKEITIDPLAKGSVLIELVQKWMTEDNTLMTEDNTGVTFVISRGPTTHPFYHPDRAPTNNDKSLKDCNIENNDILVVFSSIVDYDKVISQKRSTVHLTPANELIKGKFRLVKVTDDAGNIEYFKAVPDENGDPLFSPKHVFKVVNQTMIEMQRSGWKFISFRDNLGEVKERLLKGTNGKRIKCTLKTIHYNLNAEERYPEGARTLMGRGLMYEFTHLFSKSYGSELNTILVMLSEGLRICVGEEFVSIPERGFQITHETKGRYDGKLRFEYMKGGKVVDSFDSQQLSNRVNNTTGYTVPDYYARSRVGMGIIGCDFDAVAIVTNARFILVCEDGVVFNYLRQVKVWDHVPVVLVCAHGFPCNDTVAFVHMLRTSLQLPVFGICDMNVGGVDVLHSFGSGVVGFHTYSERRLFVSMVKWMMLRPSQLKKLRTSRRPDARNLLHSSFKKIADVFGKNRKGRLNNHISGNTTWIENGGDRKEERRQEMTELSKLQYGMDVQKAEDDQCIKMIMNSFLKVWAGRDDNKNDYAFV